MSAETDHTRSGWRKEGRDLLRAIAGGSLVGLPLLYTMEMWQHGLTLSAEHLLALFGATLLMNFAFCYVSGFRIERGVVESITEGVTAVGIALAYSAAILWLIGELDFRAGGIKLVRKVLIESVAVSVGISFAVAQIEGRSRTGDEGGEEKQSADGSSAAPELAPGDRQLRADFVEIAAAVAGSTVFALNIAPTEEVTLIAGRLSPVQLLALLATSVLLCYLILFASGFRKHEVHVESAFQHPVAETILTCAVSLCVAAGLLWLIGERSILTHPSTAVASIVVLGFPAIVGGAAGRLIT